MRYDLEAVRAALPAPEAARLLGIALAPRGGAEWACCPFHQERTPSFKVDSRGFMCFGCGQRGDSIGLIAKVMDLPYGRAIRIAATWAGIAEADDETARGLQAKARRQRAERERAGREALRRTHIHNATCDRLRALEATIERGVSILTSTGCNDIGGTEWAEVARLSHQRDDMEWQVETLLSEIRPERPTSPS